MTPLYKLGDCFAHKLTRASCMLVKMDDCDYTAEFGINNRLTYPFAEFELMYEKIDAPTERDNRLTNLETREASIETRHAACEKQIVVLQTTTQDLQKQIDTLKKTKLP